MPSSTRWRIYITAINGGAEVGIADVTMRSSVGGSDLCSGGTPAASSFYDASYAADKAFDGNSYTNWNASSASVPAWLEYQFAGAVSIVEYSIKAPAGGAYGAGPAKTPKDFSLQYFDGSGWVDADSQTNETSWAAGEVRTYPYLFVAKTRWRLYITAINGGAEAGVAALTMALTPGGSDVCTGGSATASSQYDNSYSADKAFDGNSSTNWNASSASVPAWLEYHYATTSLIAEYSIQAISAGKTPKDFSLQYFDGSGWVDADTQTNETGWSAGEARTYTFGAPPPAAAQPVMFIVT